MKEEAAKQPRQQKEKEREITVATGRTEKQMDKVHVKE